MEMKAISREKVGNGVFTLCASVDGNVVNFKLNTAYKKKNRNNPQAGPVYSLSSRNATQDIVDEIEKMENYRGGKSTKLYQFLIPVWKEAGKHVKKLR